MMRILCLIIAVASVTQAQVPFPGKCPKVNAKQPFDPSAYLGTWYEAEKYFAIFEFGGKCITATYSDRGNGVIGVLNSQLGIISNQPTTIEGTATLSGAPNEGKLSVVFPSVPFGRAAPYWVMETDYTNYSVVLSCSDFVFFNTRIVWILTRAKIPSPEVMQMAYTAMDTLKLSRAFLLKTDQTTCPSGVSIHLK